MKDRISLIFVQDKPSPRQNLAARLSAQPGFRLLADSVRSSEALERVREATPDLVLLDLRQEACDTLILAGALHGAVPDSPVILMGLQPPQVDVRGFIRAGVSGFVMECASFHELLRTIQSVSDGIQILPSELTHSLFAQLKQREARRRFRRPGGLKRLTGRERSVAGLIVQGVGNQAIAARLGIAAHTVKRLAHNVLSKVGTSHRLQVAAFSQRHSTLRAIVL